MGKVSDQSRDPLERRREHFLEAYREHMREVIDADGLWRGNEREMGFREKMWHALGLMSGHHADVRRANAVIGHTQLQRCHFTPMTCLQIMLRHGDRLDEANRTALQGYVEQSLPVIVANDRLHFTMYNDNFASMAAFICLAGGELVGNSAAVDRGLELLEGLRRLFLRCGSLMEYNSPTYTVISLHVLQEIGNLVRNPAARESAAASSRFLWRDLLAHFHTPTGRLAGPYSRAYWIDTVGHPHLTHVVMYLAFGDRIFTATPETYFEPTPGRTCHIGWQTLVFPNSAWLASAPYACPGDLADDFLHRRYPNECVSTSECLPSVTAGKAADPASVNEYPAFRAPYTTFQTEDYALGTAATQFHDGAISDSFHITYRKRSPAARLEDTGVVASRYTTARRTPDSVNVYGVSGESGPEGFRDEGRKHAIQHRNSALVLYKPGYSQRNPELLRLSIIIPARFGPEPELYVASGRVDSFPFRSSEVLPFAVCDGSFCAVFTPLEVSDLGREYGTEIERIGDYVFVSWVNYLGSGRTFTYDELSSTRNGFAVHVDSLPPESLLARVSASMLDDRVYEQEGGKVRWVRYRNEAFDVDFEYAYSPKSEGILVATINGVPRHEPIFQVSVG